MKRWLILVLTAALGITSLHSLDRYYRGQIRQENTFKFLQVYMKQKIA